jgi:hypothetical protein
MGGIRRATLLSAVTGCIALLAPTGAWAAKIVGPWNGQNPFNCTNQDVGTGVAFPDPGADPFCVEFDKTHQNVLPDQGIVDFLLNEPARTAAALPKCFYFQRDHWTGSIRQGQPPELWHWDGHYFFDKARGLGGVSVRHFRLGGIPMASPFPSAYAYPGGGGGAIVLFRTTPDPQCAALVDTPAERREVYKAWYR